MATAASELIGAESLGLTGLYDQLHWYTVGVFEKHGDPRVSNYHLMRTPWPTVAATLVYFWFVRHAGPAMMRNRKPYQILPLVRVYNLIMAAWSGWGFYTGCQLVNYGIEVLGCRPVDPYQRDEKTLSQIYYGWMFFTSRFVEFADTIFFVLRKKDNQVSNFHVFHHSSVPLAVWFFLKFAPGGNSGIFPFINTLVHTIMYSYYFLATYPAARPYLGWKKYLTQMQIVQFLIIIVGCMQPMFIPGCKFPRALLMIMMGFSVIFICLFVDFYLKAYRRASEASKQQRLERASAAVALKSANSSQQLVDQATMTTQTLGDCQLENNNCASTRNQNQPTSRSNGSSKKNQ